jgi:hypothetical protein
MSPGAHVSDASTLTALDGAEPALQMRRAPAAIVENAEGRRLATQQFKQLVAGETAQAASGLSSSTFSTRSGGRPKTLYCNLKLTCHSPRRAASSAMFANRLLFEHAGSR